MIWTRCCTCTVLHDDTFIQASLRHRASGTLAYAWTDRPELPFLTYSRLACSSHTAHSPRTSQSRRSGNSKAGGFATQLRDMQIFQTQQHCIPGSWLVPPVPSKSCTCGRRRSLTLASGRCDRPLQKGASRCASLQPNTLAFLAGAAALLSVPFTSAA